MGRVRRLMVLVSMVVGEAALVVGLSLAGRLTEPIPWHRLAPWLLHGDTEDVIVAIARLVGLMLAWWLLSTSLAYLAARACRLNRASLALGRLTLPVVRRLVDSAVAATVILSVVGGAGTAGAVPTAATAAVTASAGTEHAMPPPLTAAESTDPDSPPTEVAPSTEAEQPDRAPGFASDAAPQGSQWHVVRKGDSLWRLAEQQMGDPKRYPEIWHLNRGRRMNDGRCFRNPDRIRPGWVLAIPAIQQAPTSAPAPPPVPVAVPTPEPVAPTPTPPASPPPDQLTAPVPAATTPPQERPDFANPPTPGPLDEPALTAPPAPPTSAPAQRVPASQPTMTKGPDLPVGGLTLAGLSALAAAVIILGCRRLARRASRLGRGGDAPAMPEEQERIETMVRAVADADAARWIDAALRLHDAGVDDSRVRPAVKAIRAGTLGVELLLDQPVTPAAPGFIEEAGGWQWRLALDLKEAEERARGSVAASPALVEIGRTDDGPLLVNLESLDRLEVDGDPQLATAAIKAIAAQLACAPWAEGVEIAVLGVDLPLAGVGEAVQVQSVADAVTRSELAVAAAVAGEEGSRPAVLVSTRTLSADEAEVLDRTRPPGTPGFALVAPGPLPGAVGRLHFAPDGTGRIEPLGIDLTAAPAWPQTADNIVSLLAAHADATSPREEAAPDPTPAEEPEEEPDQATTPADGSATERPHLPLVMPASNGHHRLEVLVLGPVSLAGTDASLHRHRMESQLLVRLAVAGTPYSAAKLREDLYPSGFITDNTWASLLRRARKRFGTDPQGHPIISHTSEGCLSLSPWARCDLYRFKELASGRDPAGLEAALDLVRGEPFDVLPNGYDWVTAGLVLRTQDMIVAAASTLVDHALSVADDALALWAADQGLRAAPESEPLRVTRIRALVAGGDYDAARHTLEEVEATAQGLGVELLPETEAAVLALLGGSGGSWRRAGGLT